MRSTARSKVKAAISALIESCIPAFEVKKETLLSKAHRVGPQRVILKIGMATSLRKFEIDRIDIINQPLQFDLSKAENENVSISLIANNDDTALSSQANPEHRATLKVRPQTTRLTITYRDSDHQVYKTEKIEIE